MTSRIVSSPRVHSTAASLPYLKREFKKVTGHLHQEIQIHTTSVTIVHKEHLENGERTRYNTGSESHATGRWPHEALSSLETWQSYDSS